jgi:hypothetical protein
MSSSCKHSSRMQIWVYSAASLLLFSCFLWDKGKFVLLSVLPSATWLTQGQNLHYSALYGLLKHARVAPGCTSSAYTVSSDTISLVRQFEDSRLNSHSTLLSCQGNWKLEYTWHLLTYLFLPAFSLTHLQQPSG